MSYKWIGAVLVITGCGGFGFSLASAHRREEAALRQLLRILKFMQCELRYRLTPLPELCRQAAGEARGQLRDVMQYLAVELERREKSDAAACMRSSIARSSGFPRSVRRLLMQLGRSIGRFDLSGQLEGLEAVCAACRSELKELSHNRENRLRSYQTLGLCAGAALAILFL